MNDGLNNSVRDQAIAAKRASGPPRIAMIGCGAIAECYHLPALAARTGLIENVVLVDRSPERLAAMGEKFGISSLASDLKDVVGRIDGAIVAVPPALHHPICMQLMRDGVPVLCEKPLAESSVEAGEMVDFAGRSGVPLGVNHTRRVLPAFAEIKRLLDEKALGELVEIRWEEGCEFDWPAASGFHFRSGARGIMLDMGIHSLDLVCWWLGGQPEVVRSQTDSFGGPETMAELALRHSSCRVHVKLSWLSALANRYTIVGERGTISGEVNSMDRFTITLPSGSSQARRIRSREQTYNEFGGKLVHNFVDVISGGAMPLVPAASVLPALEVMNECYESATRMSMPWLEFEESDSYATA